MKLKLSHLVGIFFPVLIIFSSCTASYKLISIETAKPSESLLSNDIVSLTLMNRSMTDDYNNYQADSLQRFFYKNNFKVKTIILDSIAADTTLRVLGELLYGSGRYEVVIPEEHDIYRGLKYYKLPNDLEWNYVQQICRLYNTDALLVIERYINKISTEYSEAGFSYSGDKLLEASIDSKYDAVIKIYDPAKQVIDKQVIISDTIFWDAADFSQKNLFSMLPSIKEVLVQTGIKLALDLDNQLSPSWIQEQRGYFVLDKKTNRLDTIIEQGNWDDAYQYWIPYSESPQKGTRSKAEYNLALACEMLGDIKQAIEWATKSYYTEYRIQTDTYLRKLGKRKETLESFKEANN